MSIISANTLFHFTRTQEILLQILEHGFRPKYCCEFGDVCNGRPAESYIPMICFCDLPLSSIEKHSRGHKWLYKGEERSFDGYGEFGLGLSKDWAINERLNPVTYINNQSFHLDTAMGLNNLSTSIIDEYNTKMSSLIIHTRDVALIPRHIMNVRRQMKVDKRGENQKRQFSKLFHSNHLGYVQFNQKISV